MIGNFPLRRVLRFPAEGFTFVEILVVLTLLGLLALPFTRMFIFGVQGSHENAEQITAHNLAREKIEEVRSLPFELIKSDFENFRGVFRDRPNFEKAFETKDAFEKVFSDVMTREQSLEEEGKETYGRLRDLYKQAFRRDFDLYSEEARGFRRILEVDDKFDNAVPPRLKKITVRVYDKLGHKFAEVVTLVGRHK